MATKIWWAAWVVGGLLFAATLASRFRGGVQAAADGVVLTALTDVAAAVVAVLTALTVRRLSTLLSPIDPERVRFLRVVSVTGAPEPTLRATRSIPSRR